MEWPAAGVICRVRAQDGNQLAVHQIGSGPALLLIPGLGTDHHAFVWNVDSLSREFTCLVLDQRGIGLSQATPGPYTMEQLADDAAAVLENLAPAGAAVFGVSMGGMVAQHLAIRHPRLVQRLVVGCSGPGGRLAVKAAPEATRALLGGDARDPASAYRVACTVLYEREWAAAHPQVIDDAVAWRGAHPVRPGVFQAHWQAIRHHDAGGSLQRVAAPTLILHGSADLVMPKDNATVLHRLIPGSALAWLEGRGHMFFQEDPSETLRLLRLWLPRPGGRRRPPLGAAPGTIPTR
ncbi:MAG: alpha/beta fold hydrolase [Candidatus Dormibacteria bacterium]